MSGVGSGSSGVLPACLADASSTQHRSGKKNKTCQSKNKSNTPTKKDLPALTALFVFLKDALFFLKDFFTSLSTEVEFFSPPAQEGNIHQQANQLKHS